jgi:PASTA domain
MAFIKSGASAIGKLLALAVMAVAFLIGMAGVVWLSLRGEEVQVPEIVGKDFGESERELEALGLRIKKRADRYSQEKPNTILEQLPRAGDTVKTGQMILVVTSKINPESSEAPADVKKDSDDLNTLDDSESNKPSKSNKNSAPKKTTQTTRDVLSNKSNKNSNTAHDKTANTDTNAKTGTNSSGTNGNKNGSTTPANSNKQPPNSNKTVPSKTPGTGDTRTRRIP